MIVFSRQKFALPCWTAKPYWNLLCLKGTHSVTTEGQACAVKSQSDLIYLSIDAQLSIFCPSAILSPPLWTERACEYEEGKAADDNEFVKQWIWVRRFVSALGKLAPSALRRGDTTRRDAFTEAASYQSNHWSFETRIEATRYSQISQKNYVHPKCLSSPIRRSVLEGSKTVFYGFIFTRIIKLRDYKEPTSVRLSASSPKSLNSLQRRWALWV
jgi:hypothetical protein